MSLAVFACMYAGCSALMGAATIAAKIDNDRTAYEEDLEASKLPHSRIQHPVQKPNAVNSAITVIPEALHMALVWPAFVPFMLTMI
jgi:hypothetical protein